MGKLLCILKSELFTELAAMMLLAEFLNSDDAFVAKSHGLIFAGKNVRKEIESMNKAKWNTYGP